MFVLFDDPPDICTRLEKREDVNSQNKRCLDAAWLPARQVNAEPKKSCSDLPSRLLTGIGRFKAVNSKINRIQIMIYWVLLFFEL